MKNPEEISGETARDLFDMVFDEGGVAVPPDDLAPAAMAGYRRYRRWRSAVVGAGTSAAVVAVASVALVVGGGAGGVRTAPLQDPMSGPEGLWQAVFPGDSVSWARDPSLEQIAGAFEERLPAGVSAPSLYGQAQPQVVQDWAQARQSVAKAGKQSWSGFDIATGGGTITVSAIFLSEKDSATRLPCGGLTPCSSVGLSEYGPAEVSGTAEADDYQVTVRTGTGEAYRFRISSWQDPRYVDVPCSAPGRSCYADLTDGSIRPGAVPDATAVIGTPVVTHAVLVDILQRPAFAELVKRYFEYGLGQAEAGS